MPSQPESVRDLSTAPSKRRDQRFVQIVVVLLITNIILAGVMMVGVRIILEQVAREHAQTVCLLRLLPQDRTDPLVARCLSDPYDSVWRGEP